jgi:hypothetical protein
VDKARPITKAGAIADKTLTNALSVLQEVFAE